MSEMVRAKMNGRWDIMLPDHRAARPVNDWWEAQRLAATHSRIISKNRPKVLDIGAEEGDFPCLYSMWGADVFLVEPNPKAWPWIKATFEANGQKPAGWFVGLLGEKPDEELPEDSGWVWRHSNLFRWPEAVNDPDPTPEHGFHHLDEHAEVDPTWTIDDMTRAADWSPDIVTMDIEGGELHCLRGAERVLSEVRPEFFISIHPNFMRDLYAQHERDLHILMDQANYRGQWICTDHEEHWHFVPRERAWPWSDP